MVFLILSGRLRGYKWVVVPGTLEYLLGSHERSVSNLFVSAISEGDVIFDIGAYVGYYSLLAAKSVGPAGKVIAFEPLPRNVKLLRRNLGLNHVQNVRVEEAAVADKEGSASFSLGNTRSSGTLNSEGEITVRTVSLDKMIKEEGLPVPNLVKMDINGGESKAILGASSLLANNGVQLFLSTHGREEKEKCLSILRGLGYRLAPIDTEDLDEAKEIYAHKE